MEWGHLDRVRFKQFHCGTVPTKASLAKWGFNVSSACDKCGALDTTWHRIWTCPEDDVVAVREEAFPP
eukprot:2150188-Pyramimonas_sp.AAC.1